MRIENSKKNKKSSRGIALRNICTEFGADWKVFRRRNDDKTSVTDTKWSQNDRITESQTHKLLVIS